MIRLSDWLAEVPRHTSLLFDTEGDGRTVRSQRRGKGGLRRTLTRHADFDAAMIRMVEEGLEDPQWQGFLYIMHVGEGASWRPLYIGKAEKRGVKGELSANLKNIRTNHGFFGRWGYNTAYHIGNLSHAVFPDEFQTYKPSPSRSYQRWADALFESTTPPLLREPVQVTLIPWWSGSRGPSGMLGSVAAAEYELIALASAEYGDSLLNVQGR